MPCRRSIAASRFTCSWRCPMSSPSSSSVGSQAGCGRLRRWGGDSEQSVQEVNDRIMVSFGTKGVSRGDAEKELAENSSISLLRDLCSAPPRETPFVPKLTHDQRPGSGTGCDAAGLRLQPCSRPATIRGMQTAAAPRFQLIVRGLPRSSFAIDVEQGLTTSPKSLPPRYFYDSLGSALFEAICQLPEYYR